MPLPSSRQDTAELVLLAPSTVEVSKAEGAVPILLPSHPRGGWRGDVEAGPSLCPTFVLRFSLFVRRAFPLSFPPET